MDTAEAAIYLLEQYEQGIPFQSAYQESMPAEVLSVLQENQSRIDGWIEKGAKRGDEVVQPPPAPVIAGWLHLGPEDSDYVPVDAD